MNNTHYGFGFKWMLLIRFSPTLEKMKIQGKYYILDDKSKKAIRWRNLVTTISFLIALLGSDIVWPKIDFWLTVLLALATTLIISFIMVLTLSDASLDGLTIVIKPDNQQNNA